MELYFLPNIEFFSELYEDPVDSIEVIGIVSPSCGEMKYG